jgi:hypothetical protein
LTKKGPSRVDRQWVMDSIVRNVENALAANDRGAANRGLELLGREFGLFTERKIELSSPLEGLTAEQLLSLLGAAEALVEGQMIDVTPVSDDVRLHQIKDQSNDLNELDGDRGTIEPDEPIDAGDEAGEGASGAVAGPGGGRPPGGLDRRGAPATAGADLHGAVITDPPPPSSAETPHPSENRGVCNAT